MDSISKPLVWGSLTTSSRPPIQVSHNRHEANLSLDAWPELPSKGSPESTSSTLVSEKILPAKCCTPKRSMENCTSSSAECSPAPRPRPTYSEVLRPRPNPLTSQINAKALHPSEFPSSRSKLDTSESSFSIPPASQTRVGQQMAPRSIAVVGPVPLCNVAALQKSIQQDPHATFAYYQSLIQENNQLKHKLASAASLLDFERQHLKKTVQDYEELQSIGKAKHYILWQFIQRLTAGENGSHASVSEPVTCIEDPREESSMLQIDQSRDNARLDPNAQTFIPSTSTSPARALYQEYYASTPCTMTSPFSTGSNTQGFVTTPVTPPRPASQTTIFNMPTPISPSVLEAIIKSIPALFRNICPFSLTGTPCPISSCQMKRLCPRFNNQSGISTCQGRNGCRHLHEHPTCLSEAEGMGCGYTQHNSNEPQSPKGKGKWKGKGKEKMSEWDAARKLHFRCTVHPSQCGPEEWRLRLVIAGLRHAHKQGLYKN